MEEFLNTAPAQSPSLRPLEGRFVSLVALDPAAHAASLFAGTHGDGQEDLWRYMADGPYASQSDFEGGLQLKAASQDPLYYAILDRNSGLAVGHAAYLRITPAHRVIEVGSIVYAKPFQRTMGATEAMYLMARHAFEDLGYRRYEWKCDSRNEPSRRAALRLGFQFEGIFRQHMIIKGRNRDTAWFAMLDNEWPERKEAFERWLDEANFDAEGRQRTPLATSRKTPLDSRIL